MTGREALVMLGFAALSLALVLAGSMAIAHLFSPFPLGPEGLTDTPYNAGVGTE